MEVSCQLHSPAVQPPREFASPLSGTHWIAGSVGPTAGLDILEKTKIPFTLSLLPFQWITRR